MLYQCYVLSLTDDLTFICTGFFIGSLTINLKLKQPTLIPYSVLPMVYRQVDKLGKEFYDCLCVRCQESKREKTQRTFNNFTKKYMIQILVVQHLVSRPDALYSNWDFLIVDEKLQFFGICSRLEANIEEDICYIESLNINNLICKNSYTLVWNKFY